MKPKKINIHSIMLWAFFVIFFLLASMYYANALDANPEIAFYEAAEIALYNMTYHFSSLHISPSTTGSVFYAGFIAFIVIVYFNLDRKKTLPGKEHGSAHWENHKKIRNVMDTENPDNNMLLTQTEALSLNARKTMLNLNILIIGGSGSGKTRFFLKPNLMQLHSSYVITDPKGEILLSCGKLLRDAGFKIRVLNLVDFAQSCSYNPFHYLRKGNDEDVMTLINTIMTNTDGEKKSSGTDPFWEKAEMLFLQALFFYLVYEGDEEDKNIPTVMELIRLADIDENDPDVQSPLDIIFEELENESSEGSGHIAVVQYKHFQIAAGKTAKSIIISAAARLAPYNIKGLKNISLKDEMDLSKIGEEKTALFVIMSPTNTTFSFIASMLYSQLFKELDYVANWKYGGSVPVPVRFLLDEFANIGKIPDFEKILAYARSLGIGIVPIYQSLSQLKEMYKDSYETIMDNCDSFLFLGGQGSGTLEYVSKKLGKTTIDVKNDSESKGREKSTSKSWQKTARDLLTPDEVGQMEQSECILFVKTFAPFFSHKYDITKHKNYKFLGDSDLKNRFVYNHDMDLVLQDTSDITLQLQSMISGWKIQKESLQIPLFSTSEIYTSTENKENKDEDDLSEILSETEETTEFFSSFEKQISIQGHLFDFAGKDIEFSCSKNGKKAAEQYQKYSIPQNAEINLSFPKKYKDKYILIRELDESGQKNTFCLTAKEIMEAMKEDKRVVNLYDLDYGLDCLLKIQKIIFATACEIEWVKKNSDEKTAEASQKAVNYLTELYTRFTVDVNRIENIINLSSSLQKNEDIKKSLSILIKKPTAHFLVEIKPATQINPKPSEKKILDLNFQEEKDETETNSSKSDIPIQKTVHGEQFPDIQNDEIPLQVEPSMNIDLKADFEAQKTRTEIKKTIQDETYLENGAAIYLDDLGTKPEISDYTHLEPELDELLNKMSDIF